MGLPRKLTIGSIQLPTLYVCDDRQGARECRSRGIPYVIKPAGWSDEKLVKAVLYRKLTRLFPDILWDKVLGRDESSLLSVHVPETVTYSACERMVAPQYECQSEGDTMGKSDGGYRRTVDDPDWQDDPATHVEWKDRSIDSYLQPQNWEVDIDELQALHLLPEFMDDIATAIKRNLLGVNWVDGFNKKLGIPIGNYNGGSLAPNLIILDTSGSIPSGVSGTMVSLIDTLRTQANADLIITSGWSQFWSSDEDLPTPDQLSRLIGGANECRMFYKILREHVIGRHWGNVVVFGDDDAPTERRFQSHKDTWLKDNELQSTKVDNILAFHTYRNCIPGYGEWAKLVCPQANITVNTDWVKSMRRDMWLDRERKRHGLR